MLPEMCQLREGRKKGLMSLSFPLLISSWSLLWTNPIKDRGQECTAKGTGHGGHALGYRAEGTMDWGGYE